jgi:RNA polymerase sigma-70 factor (ECF subfamily)
MSDLAAAQQGDNAAFARLVAPYRRELRAHCYRMSGSLHDADDLLQESLLRAWRGLPGFEGRSDVRTWLYKVTTHACLDRLDARAPRMLPFDAAGVVDPIWVEPCPAAWYSDESSPEARLGRRESVALALLVALQRLPAKQRAVLILRDVVGWQASECAELLGLTVAAVNSALQRARDTLGAQQGEPPPVDEQTASLLGRYLAAWEKADTQALVSLLHEDATLAMPPMPEWVAGATAIGAIIDKMVFAPSGPGAFRMVALEANGLPAFASYARADDGVFRARALHILDVRDGRIAGLVAFIDASLFPTFGLAPSL